MAADAAEFIIRLQQQVSGPAGVAQSALNQLEAQIRKESAAADGMAAALESARVKLTQMHASTAATGEGVKELYAQRDAVEAMSKALAQQQAQVGALKGAQGGFQAGAQHEAAAAAAKKAADAADRARQPVRDFGDSLAESAQSAARVPGPIGAVQDALSKLGPEGQAAAVALGILTVGVTVLTAAILGGMAAAVSIVQQRAGLLATFSALAGGAAGGKKTLEMVEELGQKLPFATDRIAVWAKSLEAAGLQGSKLKSAVTAVAAATAIMGDEGGSAADRMITQLAEGGDAAKTLMKQIQDGGPKSAKLLKAMGLESKDVAKQLNLTPEAFKKATIGADKMNEAIQKALAQKGQGPMEAMMNTWPSILGKAKEGFFSLFDGLGPSVEPFMKAVRGLFGEFNKGGAATKTLKPVIQSVFSTLFTWGTKAINAIHAGLLQMIIWTLKAYIAVHPLIAKFKEFAQSANFIRGLKVALMYLAIPFVLIGAAVMVAATLFLAFIAIIGAVVAGIIYLAGAIAGFVSDAASALSDWISSAASAASDFVAGLVNGITSGAGAFAEAVKAMAMGGVAALKGALGIASPSRVAKDAATNVTSTFSDTVDDGAGDVSKSMKGMVDPKALDAKGGGKKGGGKGGREINFINCTFGDVSEGTIRQMIVAMLEGESGGGPEPEGAT